MGSISFWSGLSHLSLLYVWYSTTIGRWTAQLTSMRGTCGSVSAIFNPVTWADLCIADETCALVLSCDALVYPFALQKWPFDFCGIRANSPWRITRPAIYPLSPTGPANGARVVACNGFLLPLATRRALILRSGHCHVPHGDRTEGPGKRPLSPQHQKSRGPWLHPQKSGPGSRSMAYHGVSENMTLRNPSTNPMTCDCHMTMTYNHMTVTLTVSQRSCGSRANHSMTHY